MELFGRCKVLLLDLIRSQRR